MANKIFQLKNIALGDSYISPKQIDPNSEQKLIFIGNTETHVYISFNPETTEITEGQGDLDVRILDNSNEDDAKTLEFLKENSFNIKTEFTNIEQTIYQKYKSILHILSLMAAGDKNVIADLTEIENKKQEHLTSLGF